MRQFEEAWEGAALLPQFKVQQILLGPGEQWLEEDV